MTAEEIVKAKWPESTCVECGEKIPAGQMQKCRYGEHCSWRVPSALRAFIASFDQQLQQKLEEALADATQQEATKFGWTKRNVMVSLNDFLASRRARLGRKKERVEIVPLGAGFHGVTLDGERQKVKFWLLQDAERYAAGLRAEIGEEK